MATFSKQLLSGSTDGEPIDIVATATLGDTIHTAVSGTDDFDEIWVYASNISGTDEILTIEFGAAGTIREIDVTVPANDTVLALAGIPLQNAKVVTAFAGTTVAINVYGFVNRITA